MGNDFVGPGLSHSMGHLEDMRKDWKILKLPIEKQAEYADELCRQFNLNSAHVDELLDNALKAKDEDFQDWNVTSVGNSAYTALNGKSEQLREYERKLLERFTKWALSSRKEGEK